MCFTILMRMLLSPSVNVTFPVPLEVSSAMLSDFEYVDQMFVLWNRTMVRCVGVVGKLGWWQVHEKSLVSLWSRG